MKHKSLFGLALAGFTTLALFSGCLRDECESTRTYIRFDPVYKQPSEIRVDVTAGSPRELANPGKIYVLGQYLFINERNEGIHVFDNSDPRNPQPIAFWNIPGNTDMAVRGNSMYVNQYIDLLTLDISDLQNPQLRCRSENAFQSMGFDPQLGFIVDYLQTEVTEQIPCNDNRWGQFWFRQDDVVFLSADMVQSASANGNNKSSPLAAVGIGGSYARFALVDQYLYTIDHSLMRSWSTLGSCPARIDSVWVGWNIETIFPWKDKLFLGSQTGVFIFDNSTPQRPVMEAQFIHATGCDPVVCDDKNAYVTIHDGTTCNGTFNQLDILDIENLPSVQLEKTYAMKRPFGLAIDEKHLYLCDEGLKIFDKTDPLNLKSLSHTRGFDAYDVIALSPEQLLLIGADGFYQFDVSDPANPKELSRISVK
jgi:hypothetical protein